MANPDPKMSGRPAAPGPSRGLLSDLLREMRPRQWTKNIVIFAAFFFALGDKHQHINPLLFWVVAAAMVLFSIASSGVYIFNDILDVNLDRAHPTKYLRPVAAGTIPIPLAWLMALVCAAIGLAGSWLLSFSFGLVVIGYVLLQVVYTLWLKHLALVDVVVIATGFVLRVIGGALAAQVTISNWLLICTFLMALFLALCKRRHEFRLADEPRNHDSRPSLRHSDERLLDQLIAITAGAVIVTYAVYTLWPETVEKFRTPHLCLTLPFVIFGLFRYLDLVYRQSLGDRPEYILLTDIPLMIDIALFGLCALAIMFL